ncbi:MAG: hypothetical protein ACRD96_23115 [Bryobacteraceae bacterium]
MRIARLLKDPPPALAFELSEAGIASAPTARPEEMGFRALAPDTISVSPLRDNVLRPDELASAVRASAPAAGKRRTAAVILPDNCTRVAVVDFDSFPTDPKEQLSLVRFRLKKSVPYDVEAAAVSYWAQAPVAKRVDVVAAVAPVEIVARYEAPFRAAGLEPGLVVPSALAMLRLIPAGELAVVAKLSGRVLTLMVVETGTLKLFRCLELAAATIDDVASDLYPTCVFAEDQLERKPSALLLAGFGGLTDPARQRFHDELGLRVDPLASRLGAPGAHNAGLLGYLEWARAEAA